MNGIVIETSRLLLREMTHKDRPEIESLSTKKDVMRYLMIWMDTAEQIDSVMNEAVYKGEEPRKGYWFSVIDKADSSWIGFCLIDIAHDSDSCAEIGYILLDSHWGRGYASEILGSLIDYCFSVLKMHRVFGKCDELNTGSARVMEKCGMKREGLLREHVYLRDHWRSSVIFGILESEYGSKKNDREGIPV